jgi:hypothetical protein
MLYELIYNSITTDKSIDYKQLQQILNSSRKRNVELGITGVLLYHGGEFVQLLEGPREAVLHVFHDIIFHDTRHTALTIGWEGAITRRRFIGWSMGFAPVEILDTSKSPGLDGFMQNGAATLDFSGPETTGPRLLHSIYRQLRFNP